MPEQILVGSPKITTNRGGFSDVQERVPLAGVEGGPAVVVDALLVDRMG